VKCSIKSGNPSSQNAVRVGVLGASGYTGSEVSLHDTQCSKCVWFSVRRGWNMEN